MKEERERNHFVQGVWNADYVKAMSEVATDFGVKVEVVASEGEKYTSVMGASYILEPGKQGVKLIPEDSSKSLTPFYEAAKKAIQERG